MTVSHIVLPNGKVITAESKRVFVNYAEDAPNWSGGPMVGGNTGGYKEERGNLTQLKRAGLIVTEETRDRRNGRICVDHWVYFTPAGIYYAGKLGIDLTEFLEMAKAREAYRATVIAATAHQTMTYTSPGAQLLQSVTARIRAEDPSADVPPADAQEVPA